MKTIHLLPKKDNCSTCGSLYNAAENYTAGLCPGCLTDKYDDRKGCDVVISMGSQMYYVISLPGRTEIITHEMYQRKLLNGMNPRVSYKGTLKQCVNYMKSRKR